MESSSRDSKLFHKLVNKQRTSGSSTTKVIQVNNNVYSEPLEILDQWEKHFQQLATRPETNNQDLTREKLSKIQNDIIMETELSKDEKIQVITENEVETAIRNLNSGKAMDANGISAEHLKYAGHELTTALTQTFNKLLQNLDITQPMKEGILTPILKKGKDKTIPSNYRGITVTNVFSKVFEAIIKVRLEEILNQKQNPLQRGFKLVSPPRSCTHDFGSYYRRKGKPKGVVSCDVGRPKSL
ncbi:uncharacterized protein LOC110458857 [Mizuhopecten yessoensis]|uniref:uncharacterized protein LOC110458857 n=1 Tax=Mizuhopecten yessoensis TaxID=6573 RepID=UPI000B459DB1|nr:uncharacterized protein LOC110458857 [Mizuhopecten yessoensis]